MSFRWSFGALTGPGEEQRFAPIRRDTTLSSGDRFSMLVEPLDSCSVYLIYRDPRDQLLLLFPDELPRPPTGGEAERHYVPAGGGWFVLDEEMGLERFYLLAAAAPLRELERLLAAHAEADSSGQPPLADRIIAEIRRLKKQHRTFAVPAERPATIAGNVRGEETADRALLRSAVEISAPAFYSKTFTIDHR